MQDNHSTAPSPQELLSQALATNIEAISSVPKAGDSLMQLAKKEARSLKENSYATTIASLQEFTTANVEVYHVASTWPSIIAAEGATGVVALRATVMALYGSTHAHNVADVAKGLVTLQKLPTIIKNGVTPYEAWSVYQPIIQVIQGKLDYMESRRNEPKTAPNTPPKRQRDEEYHENKDGGKGGNGGRGGRGGGGGPSARARRSWK